MILSILTGNRKLLFDTTQRASTHVKSQIVLLVEMRLKSYY